MSSESLFADLAHFFSRERAKLVEYVRWRIDDAADRDGEDIVGEVIMGVLENVDPSLPLRNLTAYIYQAIRNRVIDGFRRRRNTVPLDREADEGLSLAETLADAGTDAAEMVEQGELRDRLSDAMDMLSERERAVIMATEVDGITFRELADEWDVPIGTLLAQKSRALKKLRGALPLQTYNQTRRNL
jgi:RNA polymerase sigma factor (sigma-70 family)